MFVNEFFMLNMKFMKIANPCGGVGSLQLL